MVLTSQYNAQGERTSLAATLNGTADFINAYSYDALAWLTDITQQSQTGGNAVAQKEVSLSYDGIGDLTGFADYDYIGTGPRTDNATGTLSHSSTTGQLTGIDYTSNGGANALDDLTYSYDTLGRVSTFESIDGTATYGYGHTS